MNETTHTTIWQMSDSSTDAYPSLTRIV
jgi:hypothetical protein